ncbi:MAG TPA: DivIVA domain-containing protein [Solirubrobacteraceae bacterium]|jgi:cell division septum initiation protein DivIVA|nr:DivIVA domain-containing protein [Solirubrobacteraceae bacterium]
MTDLDTRHPEFTVAIRGYDRLQVDEYIARLQKLLSEAEGRVKAAESDQDFSSHAAIGPRLAEIFELAAAEARELRSGAERDARELRSGAERDAKKRVADAKAYAKELVAEARETARATAEQGESDYERMVAQYEQDRERIRAEVGELEGHRSAILDELGRLHAALGTAMGMVEAPRESPREEVIALAGSELTTVELPQRASAAQ